MSMMLLLLFATQQHLMIGARSVSQDAKGKDAIEKELKASAARGNHHDHRHDFSECCFCYPQAQRYHQWPPIIDSRLLSSSSSNEHRGIGRLLELASSGGGGGGSGNNDDSSEQVDRDRRLSQRLLALVVVVFVSLVGQLLGDNYLDSSNEVVHDQDDDDDDVSRCIVGPTRASTESSLAGKRGVQHDEMRPTRRGGRNKGAASISGSSPGAMVDFWLRCCPAGCLAANPQRCRSPASRLIPTSTLLSLTLALALATPATLARGPLLQSQEVNSVPVRQQQQQQRNPYLISPSNSTKSYLERHNFGLRIAHQQLGAISDINAVSPQSLSPRVGATVSGSLQTERREGGSSRAEERSSELVGPSNRNRTVRHLLHTFDGGNRLAGSPWSATNTSATGWHLDNDNDGDDGGNRNDLGGKNYSSSIDDSKDTGTSYRREHETSRGTGSAGLQIQIHQQQQQPQRRDSIVGFLSQLPGLASLRAASAGLTRQPTAPQQATSLAAKLAAKLRSPTAVNNNTAAALDINHSSGNRTGDFRAFPQSLPANGSSSSSIITPTTKDYQVVSYAPNSSWPQIDWLSEQASDNVEQVIQVSNADHAQQQHQKQLAAAATRENKQATEASQMEGEHQKGYEQRGDWKKERQGKELELGSLGARSKEGAKSMDDVGHNKHGWKNVYHKEEYAQHLKFHDLYRDKNWDNTKGHQEELEKFNKGEKFNDSQSKNFYDIDNHGKKYDYTRGSQWKRYEEDNSDSHHAGDKHEMAQERDERPTSLSKLSLSHQHEPLASGSMNRHQQQQQPQGDHEEEGGGEGAGDDEDRYHGEAVIEQMKAKLDRLSGQKQHHQQKGGDFYSQPPVRSITDVLKLSGKNQTRAGPVNGSASSEVADFGDNNGIGGDDNIGNDDGIGEQQHLDRPAAGREDRKNELRLKLELDLGKSVNHGQQVRPRQRNHTTTSSTTTTTMLPMVAVPNLAPKWPEDHGYLANGKWQHIKAAGWRASEDRSPFVYRSNYSGRAPLLDHGAHRERASSHRMNLLSASDAGDYNKPSLAQSAPQSRPIIVKHLQMNGGIVMGRVTSPARTYRRDKHNSNNRSPLLDKPPMGSEESFASSLADHDEILEQLPASKQMLYDLSYTQPQPAPSNTPAREYLISFERANQASASEHHRSQRLRRPQHMMEQLEQAEPGVLFEAAPSEQVLALSERQRRRRPAPSLFGSQHHLPGELFEGFDHSEAMAAAASSSDDEDEDDFQQFVLSNDRRLADGIQLEPIFLRESGRSRHSIPLRGHQDLHVLAESGRRQRQTLADLLRASNYSQYEPQTMLPSSMFGVVDSTATAQPPPQPPTPLFSQPQAILSRLLRLPRVFGVLAPQTVFASQSGLIGQAAASQRPIFVPLDQRAEGFSLMGGDLMSEASRTVTTRLRPPLQWPQRQLLRPQAQLASTRQPTDYSSHLKLDQKKKNNNNPREGRGGGRNRPLLIKNLISTRGGESRGRGIRTAHGPKQIGPTRG